MTLSLLIGGRSPHARTFRDIQGRSILHDFPGRVLLVLDTPADQDYGPSVTVEVVAYMEYSRVLALARQYHKQEGITSITTFDEGSVELAADLRQALGIGGMLVEEAKLHRDKVAMKACLRAAGVRVPDWAEATDLDAVLVMAGLVDQIVMKPRTGQGARQVAILRGTAAITEALQRCRNPADFEVEEYIEGCLYHTNSIVIDGRPRFTAIAKYIPGMGNIDYTRGTPFVCLMEPEGELHARLLAFSVRVIEALGLRNGITHMELFHSSDDEIVFCETAIRPGGGGIVHMIEAQFGINMVSAALLVDAGCGEKALVNLKEGHTQMGLIGLRNSDMGTAQMSDGWDRFDRPWVQLLEISVRPGAFRPPSSHCTDFTALVILAADDLQTFHERIGEVSDHFSHHFRLV